MTKNIIICDDCKYCLKLRDKESAKKFGQIRECQKNIIPVPKPSDFCSKAEMEAEE